ncbi:MAG: penicillin-binding protein [Melioribacteraceae bacterium]|nr:MAG: penicillin-binding protein [Melioribacteraceae bacterium]
MAKNNKSKGSRLKKVLLGILGVLVTSSLVAGFFLFQYIVEGLPSLEQLENPKQSLASNVYSKDGVLIGQFFRENRIEANIDSLPGHLIDALVATEDREFYDHWGVDLERFIKAMFKNVFLFKREGASTITQQLAKNLYELKYQDESLYDTGVRKMREWITAVQIEKSYTKREILEMYLNESFFGNRAYGVEMAARIYFNKPAKELTIEEGAVFIALLKSWVYYNPVRRYNNSLQRRNLVMYNMVQAGYLERAEYDSLKNLPIELSIANSKQQFKSSVAPHFVEHVRQQLEKMSEKYGYDLYEDGLSIYTTLDSRMQQFAVKATVEHLDEFQKQFDKHWNWKRNRDILDDLIDKAIKRRSDYRSASNNAQKKEVYNRLKRNVAFVDSVQLDAQRIEAGFVVVDVHTGEIRAMVGARDQNFRYGLNHVTQIKRQPGSSFKPILYTTAINNGLYPAYPILNQRFLYPATPKDWSPQNFDRTTSGYMTIREALMNSKNIVAARLIIEDHVKLWEIGETAKKLGINTRLDLVPAIALGVSEVSPIELTSVFATIANKGIYNEPISILRIEDKDGIIVDNFSSTPREAISEESAYIMTNMMQSVVDRGTAIRVRAIHKFYAPAAGKTGTTQDYADAWFVGFTPKLAAGAWVGFDDRRITFTGSYGQGAKAACPIWSNFMKMTYDSLQIEPVGFSKPETGNVVTVDFCKESIYELGDPKLFSKECNTGKVTDIINIKDLPQYFNSERDTTIKIFNKYWFVDSTSHEALEIVDDE